jgi:hypothetical protein
MNRERFSALAEAYGGDLKRWPAGDRAAAQAWLISTPGATDVLAQARQLDEILSTHAAPSPSPDLQRRVVTSMLAQRREPGSVLGWLPVLGALGALAAGVFAGATVIAVLPVAGPTHAGSEPLASVYEQSSFGDLTAATPAPDEASDAWVGGA